MRVTTESSNRAARSSGWREDMRRREILVFIAAFVVVLLGGAALAQVGTFSSTPASDAAAISAQPAGEDPTPDTTEADKVEPVAAEVVDTTAPKDEPKRRSSYFADRGHYDLALEIGLIGQKWPKHVFCDGMSQKRYPLLIIEVLQVHMSLMGE